MNKVFLVVNADKIGFAQENPEEWIPLVEASPLQRRVCDRVILDKYGNILKRITKEELEELDKGLFNSAFTFESVTNLIEARR